MGKKEELLKRKEQIQKALQALGRREKAEERKARNHRIMRLGAMLEASAKPEAKALIKEFMKAIEIEDQERAKKKAEKEKKEKTQELKLEAK